MREYHGSYIAFMMFFYLLVGVLVLWLVSSGQAAPIIAILKLWFGG